jgi:hypothetical protein
MQARPIITKLIVGATSLKNKIANSLVRVLNALSTFEVVKLFPKACISCNACSIVVFSRGIELPNQFLAIALNICCRIGSCLRDTDGICIRQAIIS